MICTAANDNRRVKQTMLRYFKRVANFRDKHNPDRSVRDALRICFLISRFLENDGSAHSMDFVQVRDGSTIA